ncbi:MAG: carboxypeptidase regulatory-like domain-containing protein, partial [Herpetosiphonaceae bacterium]|nr:carboxypeptidase regulatory-like domain-containing protein [Herpetosiphonaceae bacterium]
MRVPIQRTAFFATVLVLISLLLITRSTFTASASPVQQTGAEPMDLGDAPDSTNHAGVGMSAYPAVPARYPTVFDPSTGLPEGPSHINNQLYFLGDAVTSELEADGGPDADGPNNIQPGADIPNLDRADDAFWQGVPSMGQFANCVSTALNYRVTVVAPPTSGKAYVNIWIDWNHNGAWGGGPPCSPQTLANEWAVQNQLVNVSAAGVFNLTTPVFLAAKPGGVPPQDGWLRITISDSPATNDDGRGPANRWRYGETEDYLLPIDQADITPTPTQQTDITPEPTKTPITDATWTPTPAGQVTNTPTKTPITDITPEPTKTPITDATWTPTKVPTVTPTVTKVPTLTPTPTNTPTPPNEIFSDLGDAPDSTNSFGAPMTAYVVPVPAQFPTVFNAVAPFGPFHFDTRLFHLGRKVTNERQADMLFDVDIVHNISPTLNIADQDRADDGLLLPKTLSGLPHCVPTKMTYTVTYNGVGTRQVYFNMWADWNRSGMWGGALQCGTPGLAREWAVTNQPIVLVPGLNTFTSPVFLPYHKGKAGLWFRMTVSDTVATLDNGSGPAFGWKLGETEDYFLSPDLGDAPDSHNSLLVPMRAYPPFVWPLAKFPTVFNRIPATTPRGPIHHNLGVRYVLGRALTGEAEADTGPDDDLTNNLQLGPRIPNSDRADDAFWMGVPSANSLGHCVPKTLNYRVTLPSSPAPSGTAQAYVNVWMDWNRNGEWGGARKCLGTPWISREWAVQNQLVTLSGPGTYNLTTPVFISYQPGWPRPMWLRITISDTPATAADGRGPTAGWAFGETEDYLLKAAIIHGGVSGTVHTAAGLALPNSLVSLFAQTEPVSPTRPLIFVRSQLTDANGNYEFPELPAGHYLVQAKQHDFQPQWFNHASVPADAQTIAVSSTIVPNINFDLLPLTPPIAHVVANGEVHYDPAGHFGLGLRRGMLSNVKVIIPSECITCPNGLAPTNVRLVLRYPGNPTNLQTYPLTLDPVTNTYQHTIPVADLNALFGPNQNTIEVYVLW